MADDAHQDEAARTFQRLTQNLTPEELAGLTPAMLEEIRVQGTFIDGVLRIVYKTGSCDDLIEVVNYIMSFDAYHRDQRNEAYKGGLEDGCAIVRDICKYDRAKGRIEEAWRLCAAFDVDLPEDIQLLEERVEAYDQQLNARRNGWVATSHEVH